MAKRLTTKKTENNILYQHCIKEWLPVIESSRKNFIVKKSDAIFKEGDIVDGVFFITAGKVKVHQSWGTAKELILRFANSGDIIGYRGLGKEKVYPVTATTLEDSQVFYISMEVFEATLRVNPRLTYMLMDFYANELEETEKRMKHMAHIDVKGRIAETLLLLKHKFGTSNQGYINIRLTKQDIASYVGTTYETISRMTAELENDRLIKTNGKDICILKEQQLKNIIC